jgi:hypothetical protein
MPLPIPSPKNDAALTLRADWLAYIERQAAAAPPPPGRAECEASVRAAERAILGPRRVPIW